MHAHRLSWVDSTIQWRYYTGRYINIMRVYMRHMRCCFPLISHQVFKVDRAMHISSLQTWARSLLNGNKMSFADRESCRDKETYRTWDKDWDSPDMRNFRTCDDFRWIQQTFSAVATTGCCFHTVLQRHNCVVQGKIELNAAHRLRWTLKSTSPSRDHTRREVECSKTYSDLNFKQGKSGCSRDLHCTKQS